MAVKKHQAPPGCDYEPICGENPNVSYGVVLADTGEKGVQRTLTDVLFRRYYPTERPSDPHQPWTDPTADKTEVIPPRGAPNAFWDPQYLANAYHLRAEGKIRHLAAIVTIRFPEVDAVPATLMLHEAWFLATGLARRISGMLTVAVVATMHVPGRSWGLNPPHCHLIIPCRTILPGTGFSTFVKPLIEPEVGRPLIDAEWAKWRKESGYGD